MCPLACARIAGSTRRVISAAAKKLTSICSRNCSGENSSTAPSEPRPAMLARTSMRPKRSSAASTAVSRASASVTSSPTASARSIGGGIDGDRRAARGLPESVLE